MELVVPGVVAQAGLALLHRAHGTEKVGEHNLPVLQGGAVLGFGGYVVGVVGQKQQVAALQVQALHGLLVEGLPGLQVLELRIPQGHEQPVLVAVRHLLGGEHQVKQILPQLAGEGFFQQGEILLRLLLGHEGQGLVQVGDNLPTGIHIAAVNALHGVFLRLPPATQLGHFFCIHRKIPHFKRE